MGRNLSAPSPVRTCSCSPPVTDTFGLVLLESLACGTPVAAYPVTGPLDILADGAPRRWAALDTDLRAAAMAALAARAIARPAGRTPNAISWRACAEVFLSNLAKPVQGRIGPRAARIRPEIARAGRLQGRQLRLFHATSLPTVLATCYPRRQA